LPHDDCCTRGTKQLRSLRAQLQKLTFETDALSKQLESTESATRELRDAAQKHQREAEAQQQRNVAQERLEATFRAQWIAARDSHAAKLAELAQALLASQQRIAGLDAQLERNNKAAKQRLAAASAASSSSSPTDDEKKTADDENSNSSANTAPQLIAQHAAQVRRVETSEALLESSNKLLNALANEKQPQLAAQQEQLHKHQQRVAAIKSFAKLSPVADAKTPSSSQLGVLEGIASTFDTIEQHVAMSSRGVQNMEQSQTCLICFYDEHEQQQEQQQQSDTAAANAKQQ
jgi:hypothetical protein